MISPSCRVKLKYDSVNKTKRVKEFFAWYNTQNTQLLHLQLFWCLEFEILQNESILTFLVLKYYTFYWILTFGNVE